MEYSTKPDEKSKKIFVGGYDSATRKHVLFKYFSKFGKVEKIINHFNKKNNAQGYCFIKYEQAESAQRVLAQREHRLNNRTLNCRPVLKGKVLRDTVKNMDSRRLFLSGLRKFTSESKLLEKLSQYGEVENLYLIKRNDKTTNIAYLTLKYQADVKKLLNVNISLDGSRLYI